MSEWWTYTLSDFLLFSPRTYYRLFELHNADLWPLQVAFLGLGIAILISLRHGGRWRGRFVGLALAGCWVLVAWAFHWHRYATINWAASYFALAFAVEALLLTWMGAVRNGFEFGPEQAVAQRIGFGLFAFALLAQPWFGPIAGRDWTQMESFGTTPDPTALATLGLLLAVRRNCWVPMVIPLLWCALSGAVLWTMGSPDALLMPVAGLAALFVAFRKGRRTRSVR